MNTLLHKVNERIDALKEVNKKSSELVVDILMRNEHIILDLNTEEQLMKGQRSDGSILPDYSPASVEVFGKPSGPIKLFDEGGFYQGFQLEDKVSQVVITSNDEKADMLEMRYGSKIYGLTPENFVEVRDFYVLVEMLEIIEATQK